MAEFEEGEILDSDSGAESSLKEESTDDWIQGGYNPLSRPVASTQYCSAAKNVQNDFSSSDEEHSSNSSSDSEDCIPIKQMKNKHVYPPTEDKKKGGGRTFNSAAAKFQSERMQHKTGELRPRKKNSIWESVLQEQQLTHELTGFGVNKSLKELDNGRDVETYDYTLAIRSPLQDESSEEDELNETEKRHSDDFKGRKRSLKQRLGKKTESDNKRDIAELTVTTENTEEEIARDIATKLFEPKENLIASVVGVLGKQMAITLFQETKEIEKNGGMMTVNGMRRRSPGGVYLHHLKNHQHIPQEKIREVFKEDVKARENVRKKMKARRRNKKANTVKINLDVEPTGELQELPRRMDIELKKPYVSDNIVKEDEDEERECTENLEVPEKEDYTETKCKEMEGIEYLNKSNPTVKTDFMITKSVTENNEKNMSPDKMMARTEPTPEHSDDDCLDICINDVEFLE